jgi:Protein of unknown function (DUF2889)
MSLPVPVEREAFHHRRIAVDGYRRSDGLWDIEAHMVDTKTYGFDNAWRGEIKPGEPLHDMWLRVTLDDRMVVRDVVAVAAAHPFRACPEITVNFRRLIGETIGAGWTKRVRALLGGVAGCTHLVDLLGPIGTIAIQTIKSARAQALMKDAEPTDRAAKDPAAPRRRPAMIDSCHAMRSDGEVVERLWPDFYTPAESI